MSDKEDTTSRGHHVRWIAAVSLLALLAMTMLLTCPSAGAHRKVISNLATDVLGDIVEEKTESAIAGIGASLLASSYTDKLFDYFFDVHDYGLFSYCEYNFDGKRKLVSVGVLGHVYTCNSEQVRRMLDKERQKGVLHD